MSSSLFSYVFSGKSSSDSENDGENNFDTFVPIDIDKIVPRRKKSNIKASDVVVDLDDLNDEFVNYHEEETKKYDGGGGDGCYRGGSCSTPQKRENSVNDFGSTSEKRDGNRIVVDSSYAPPPSNSFDFAQSQTARYVALCKSFKDLGAIGSCSISRFNYVMGVIEKEKYYVENILEEEETKGIPLRREGQANSILDPIISQTKGRKKGERFKSGLETSTSNKPRKCTYCGILGAKHDKRNCPSKPF